MKPSDSFPREKNHLLNTGLSLAMAWDADWLKPIQPRLAEQFPTLTPEELDEINASCQQAMRAGHALVASLAKKDGINVGYSEWETEFLHHYPWVNQENLSRLFSQGMYYNLK